MQYVHHELTDAMIDHKQERQKDIERVLFSKHDRRVVVAGPGTGKSYLFQEVIKEAKKEGKTNFLAVTFIGKLSDALADELAGLAETVTLHGLARRIVLENCPKGWAYYPDIASIVEEDLAFKKIKKYQVGDDNYKERTKYYKSVGDDDVVHYALQTLKKNDKAIPRYDLILVDEFQDFNESEAQLIDLLSEKNKVLIVGDDDQALYEFKGSSPRYIREKFHPSNKLFEQHTLRFCSRCTPVIVEAFHSVVQKSGLSASRKGRINKEYLCYLPDKEEDGRLNPKILLSREIPPGEIPFRIHSELSAMLKGQKIKSVLIIGEGRSCKYSLVDIATRLKQVGFKNVDHRSLDTGQFSLKRPIIDGYKYISGGKNELLGWRILLGTMRAAERKKVVLETYDKPEAFMAHLAVDFKERHERNAGTLRKILTKTRSEISRIGNSTMGELMEQMIEARTEDRDLFVDQLVDENRNLARPLGNLEITVCNILGSKGLGADVVFLVGFDQGKLPMKDSVTDSETYQMLVALTRARKRMYLVNTIGRPVSKFLDFINPDCFQES